MPSTQTATCQACGWHGPVEQTLQLRDVLDRVLPGDVMPAGECPLDGCHGAAMLDDRSRSHDDLRPPMVALMLGLERLYEDILAGAAPRPYHSCINDLADYARKALESGAALKPVCNTCGSDGVLVDAWAAWDIAAQRWELHSTYEPTAICRECDVECSYSMKPVPRNPA